MQSLLIAGNVGKDAVLRHTQGGDPVLNFTLAVDNGKDANGNRRDPTWYDCSIWGKRATALERHIVKGIKLTLRGRPSARAHEGKAYLGINVDELTFMGGGSDRDDGAGRRDDSLGGAQNGYGRAPSDMEDQIPFSPEWRV